jgi:hypothetical protein
VLLVLVLGRRSSFVRLEWVLDPEADIIIYLSGALRRRKLRNETMMINTERVAEKEEVAEGGGCIKGQALCLT